MALGRIKWNGVWSDTLGIFVEKAPNYKKPKRKFDVFSVPGRSGDIVLPQDAWENVEQEYSIVCGNGSVQTDWSSVSAWLFGVSGYGRLEDDFDVGRCRNAYFAGPFDIENLMNETGRATIRFVCDPRRFYSDARVVDFYSPGEFSEPDQKFVVHPIVVTENAFPGAEIAINDVTMVVGDYTGHLKIDCESKTCTGINGENLNNKVSSSAGEFFRIPPGKKSRISFQTNAGPISLTLPLYDI